jgi:Icc-related predicted phosphoesterase
MLLERFDPTVQVVGHVGEVLEDLEKGCFVLFAKT